MHTMSFITTLFFAMPFFLRSFCSNAAILTRDVFDPQITYPQSGTVWHVGEIHNVTWDTSILPPGLNQTGMVVLGFLNDTANDGNEHLDLDHPLATNFQLTAGRVNITVPAVTPMDSYIIILFGDSGNASPQFTITNVSISTPPSSVASIPSATPSSDQASTVSSLVGGSSATLTSTGSSAISSSSNSAANVDSAPSEPPPGVSSSTSSSSISSNSMAPSSSSSPSLLPSPSPSPSSTNNSNTGLTQTNFAQANFVPFLMLSPNAVIIYLLSYAMVL